MPRPRKQRKCNCPHRARFTAVYKPAGTPLKDLAVIHLDQDELEALHLCDGEGKTQEEAGSCMEVSRGTVQRLLASARNKVARAIVGHKALAISKETLGGVIQEESAPDVFAELKEKAMYMSEAEGLPDWLLNEVLEITADPGRYSDKTDIIRQLAIQLVDFDLYAGTGCFGDAVSADTISAIIGRIKGT